MTAPALGEGHRRALLIGTGTYDRPELSKLLSPEADCAGLTEVLRDPEIGQFEVQTLVDADRPTLERAIEEFFLTARRDDVCLLYFSCHGVRNRSDKLYFAVRNTDPERPAHSAISASFVHDMMDECRARSVVVVVDCCYSGLFIPGAKGSESAGFEEVLAAGHGRVIITAGTRMQRAWEGDHSDAETPALSRFTSAIVEGLRSGDADLNGDGFVTLQELFKYTSERLHLEGVEQTPRMGGEIQYDIALARVKKKRRQRSSRTAKTTPSGRAASTSPIRRVEVPWRISAASGSARQPVLSGGTLVVHEKYSLHVFDAESRRRYPLIQTNYPGGAVFHSGTAYFPGPGSLLRTVDLRTGKPRRSARLQVCDGLLSVSGETLYATSPDGFLHSIDVRSEGVRWSQVLGQPAVCPPEVAAGRVIVITEEPRPPGDATDLAEKRVQAFLEVTGQPIWSYRAEGPLSGEGAVTDSGIYLVQRVDLSRQSIVAVDPATGEPLWRFEAAADLAVAPAALGGLVVFGDVENRLVALDAKSGAQLWDRKTKGRVLTRPFAVGDTLFTADRAATLTAWKLPVGRKLRSYDVLLSSDRQGAPACTNDWLYMTDSHGDLHALPTNLHA